MKIKLFLNKNKELEDIRECRNELKLRCFTDKERKILNAHYNKQTDKLNKKKLPFGTYINGKIY